LDTTLGNFYLQQRVAGNEHLAPRHVEDRGQRNGPLLRPQPIHAEYYESTETVTKKVLEPLPVVKGQDSCLNQTAKR
jgi:hypothetical protein